METKEELQLDINNTYYYFLNLLAYENILSKDGSWTDNSEINNKIKVFIDNLKKVQLETLKCLNHKCSHFRNEFKQNIILDFYIIEYDSTMSKLFYYYRTEKGVILNINPNIHVEDLVKVFIQAEFNLVYEIKLNVSWNFLEFALQELIKYFALEEYVSDIYKNTNNHLFATFLKEEYLVQDSLTPKKYQVLYDSIEKLKQNSSSKEKLTNSSKIFTSSDINPSVTIIS